MSVFTVHWTVGVYDRRLGLPTTSAGVAVVSWKKKCLLDIAIGWFVMD